MGKIINEFWRRKKQSEIASSGRERVMHEMKMKTAIQGRQMLEKHIKDKMTEIVPPIWRKIAEYLPPKSYIKFWYYFCKALFQPARLIEWFIKIIFIKPIMAAHKIIWKGGCWSEITKLNEWVVKIKIYRGTILHYKADFDWRNGHTSEVWKKKGDVEHHESLDER